MPVAQCNARFNIPCTFSGIDSTAQWWTVEREEEYNVIFVLHQARSTNRGSYSAEVEGVDPATQSLRTIGKIIFVSGKYWGSGICRLILSEHVRCVCGRELRVD